MLATAFPKVIDAYDLRQTQGKKSETIQWAVSRRWSVYGDLISRLGKLAAVRNLAIVLISQTTTKIRPATGAVLYPFTSIKTWDGGVHNRIVLFRDWLPKAESGVAQNLQPQGVRLAASIKVGGASCDGLEKLMSFTIEKVGIRKRRDGPKLIGTARLARKRRLLWCIPVGAATSPSKLPIEAQTGRDS